MSHNVVGTCVLVGLTVALLVLAVKIGSTVQEQIYDCSIAEFHPDYPKEVKEKCRDLRRKVVIET